MALNSRQAVVGYLWDLQDPAVNTMWQQTEALSSGWNAQRNRAL
ncbi:MAG TPA: hypothetical protein VIN38_15220 [Thiobacillus sp.]